MNRPLAVITILLLTSLAALHAADLPTAAPEVWLIPPPWPGNGQCLRELVLRGDEWKSLRGQVRGIGTYAWLLNVHHSDDDLRAEKVGRKRFQEQLIPRQEPRALTFVDEATFWATF